jgi:hypothetical protein
MLGGATTISVADCDGNVVGRPDSYDGSSAGLYNRSPAANNCSTPNPYRKPREGQVRYQTPNQQKYRRPVALSLKQSETDDEEYTPHETETNQDLSKPPKKLSVLHDV